MSSAKPPARQRLLDAADQLFYAEGVHRVGIDRIIEEAGVAKGSLFYNFAGKEDLVTAYLAGRYDKVRARVARHQHGLDSPIDRLIAIFDSLQEAVLLPDYRGCPFANATAEASPGSAEANALRVYREWLRRLILSLCEEAAFRDTDDVTSRLCLLYDGAVATTQLDNHKEAVGLAKELAAMVLTTSPRSDTGTAADSGPAAPAT